MNEDNNINNQKGLITKTRAKTLFFLLIKIYSELREKQKKIQVFFIIIN